jgi:hypothetical protein
VFRAGSPLHARRGPATGTNVRPGIEEKFEIYLTLFVKRVERTAPAARL